MATTVTSKGQVTIPKPVRDHLGIVPGSQIAFRRAADGSIVIERADGTRRPGRFDKGNYDRMKASRSALITSAFVVHMPCGKPGYTLSVPFLSSLA